MKLTSTSAVNAVVAACATAFTTALASAATLLVPGQYVTIQDAVDAAADGDVVRIADGAYTGVGNRGIDTLGKAITIRSASLLPGQCVIDCEGLDRGFLLDGGEGPGTVLEGLTITNGLASNGGAIYCVGASPIVRNCRIVQNFSNGEGAGIALEQSDAVIRNCTIRLNATPGNYGGGGGVSIKEGSNATIEDCTIEGNLAHTGGGVFIVDSDPVIVDSNLVNNTAESGGGVYATGGNARFANSRISGNVSNTNGGGIYLTVTEVRLANCRVNLNHAQGDGGGLFTYATSTVRAFNSTLYNNSATGRGNGIANVSYQAQYPSDLLVKNTIVRGSEAPIYNEDASTYDLAYCNIEGGFAGAGNIDADPLFVDADGSDNDPATWFDNDYRLNLASPCIDAGDNTALPADLLDLDDDGDTGEPFPVDTGYRPRFVDDLDTADTGNGAAPIVDMGAFEFQYCLADLDGDGDTDQADLGILLASYNIDDGGDLDGDGDTDQADLGALLSDYNCQL